MSGAFRHPATFPAVIIAGLVLVIGVAHWTLPARARPADEPDITHASLGRMTAVCPEPSAGRVAVATSSEGGVSGRGGRAKVSTLAGDTSGQGAASEGAGDQEEAGKAGEGRKGAKSGGRVLHTIKRRGTTWTREVGAESSAVVVRARGSMAAGLEVEQVSDTGAGPGQGLSSVRCGRPDSDFWFVGDGVGLDRSTRLYLANPDDSPVTLSVEVYGPSGPLAPAAGSGITVGPRARKSIGLAALAPKGQIIALHVRTDGGRVAAAVHTRAKEPSPKGNKAPGIDWIPRTFRPSEHLVVPGLPPGKGHRRLLLAAPGNRPAKVQARVVTGQGTYAPKGKRSVRVPAGSVVSVNLAKSLSGRAAAVRLSSDEPIVASAAVSVEDEVAYTSAVPPLRDEGAVVADNGPSADVVARLLVSAPIKLGAVQVRMLGPKGPVGKPRTVKIPAGRTVRVKIHPPSAVQGDFAVVVTPVDGSGPVYGARTLRRDVDGQTSLTVLPLRTSRTRVRVPDTEESLSAAFPRQAATSSASPAP